MRDFDLYAYSRFYSSSVFLNFAKCLLLFNSNTVFFIVLWSDTALSFSLIILLEFIAEDIRRSKIAEP